MSFVKQDQVLFMSFLNKKYIYILNIYYVIYNLKQF